MKRIAAAFLSIAAIVAAAADERPTDKRFHVEGGSISGSDPIVLTPEGEAVAFTASFSIPDATFIADPYSGTCRFVTYKYTLKAADQREILGDQYKFPDPGSEDSLVLHPYELRNAAPRYKANAIYFTYSDSEDLKSVKGLHDCVVESKIGSRYRGEASNEVACKTPEGTTAKFSEYAGRAAYYSCPPQTQKDKRN